MKLDDIIFPRKISFVKIDTKGSEKKVLLGMNKLIKNDSPIILIEENDSEVAILLSEFGYKRIKLNNSRNALYLKWFQLRMCSKN